MIIKNDKSEIEQYLVDSANYQGHCDAVYFPENESDIIQILNIANQIGRKLLWPAMVLDLPAHEFLKVDLL